MWVLACVEHESNNACRQSNSQADNRLSEQIALFALPIWLALHFGLMPLRNRK
jgi:hypothetical protein